MPKPSRDNNWLLSRLDTIWTGYFEDITQDNPITIKFGRYSKYRLGSIKLNRVTKMSLITITGMFKSEKVAPEVVDHTIAHELIHYAHGFSSQKPRLHKYPHAGGIVNKEMSRRGMSHLIKAYKMWVKEYKQSFSTSKQELIGD